jgi:hypothetical protein
MSRVPFSLGLLVIVFAAGCSSQQLYGAGQAWQQNECRKLPASEQQRCFSSNAMSYDEYQRQAAAAKGR